MNAMRRKRLDITKTQLDEICEELEYIKSEEEEALENMPESLQESERASDMQGAIDDIGSAISSLEEASYYIESVINE